MIWNFGFVWKWGQGAFEALNISVLSPYSFNFLNIPTPLFLPQFLLHFYFFFLFWLHPNLGLLCLLVERGKKKLLIKTLLFLGVMRFMRPLFFFVVVCLEVTHSSPTPFFLIADYETSQLGKREKREKEKARKISPKISYFVPALIFPPLSFQPPKKTPSFPFSPLFLGGSKPDFFFGSRGTFR